MPENRGREDKMKKLIVFLGNPGKDYVNTRHNAGFLLSDHLFPSLSWQSKFHSMYSETGEYRVIKPLIFMNLSGTAVSECATFFKIKPEEILIVHDDLELPLGKVKMKKGGGLQGHNGLRNIKERIGSDGFWRLRIGIGRPKNNDVRLYVTSPFTKDESILLANTFNKIYEKRQYFFKEWEFSID